MAKVIDWKSIVSNIIRHGSTLKAEAQVYDLTEDELRALGDKQLGKGDKGWSEAKRRSKNNAKRVHRNSSSAPAPAPTASAPAPAQLTQTVEERQALPPTATTTQPTLEELESLEAKKASLRAELETVSDQLAEARRVSKIKTETVQQATNVVEMAKQTHIEAQKALDKAQKALREAESDADRADREVSRLEATYSETDVEIRGLDSNIEKVKENLRKKIYLVDPFYTGERPKYGTFYSSEEMEGVVSVSVKKEYTLDLVTQSILLYKDTMDVLRVKAFTELVWMFGLEGISYTILATEKTKEFIEMYF